MGEPWHKMGAARSGLASVADPRPQVQDDEAPGGADAGPLDGSLEQRRGGLRADLHVLGSSMWAIPHVSGLGQGVGRHALHRPHVARRQLWHLQWTNFNAEVALLACEGGTNRQAILRTSLTKTQNAGTWASKCM